jgi:predicted nucleotidyltransferase
MLDLSHRRELAWLAQLVADLRSALPQLEPLITGALARDLWLHYRFNLPIHRATEDVDFALLLNWTGFSEAWQSLLATGLFERVGGGQHKLRHRRHGWIDLIPFGEVERADATIAWPPAHEEIMNVMGYAEANASAITVKLPQDESAALVSLPMLAVLKVLAWKDRGRTTRGKDAVDLALILSRYLEAGNQERLYAEFASVIDENFDFERTGAWLLGRDARTQMLEHSKRFDQLIEQLAELLTAELDPEREQALVLQMNPKDPDDALKLLRAFHRGLMGAEAP